MARRVEFKSLFKNPEKVEDFTRETNEQAPRQIRVTNRLDLDNLTELHTQRSATYMTQNEEVTGLIDWALRKNGLVLSWITEEAILGDNIIDPESVILDRIKGIETYYTLLNPGYYLDGFSPVVMLMQTNGHEKVVKNGELGKLNLSGYLSVDVGVRFTPTEMSPREIATNWIQRYHGLSEGNVELTPHVDIKGRKLPWVYSLVGGMRPIHPGDVPTQECFLNKVYSKDGTKIDHPYRVDRDTLIVVVDRQLDGSQIYRECDTYFCGQLDKRSQVYLLTLPGLERAFLKRFPITDPRDLGILIEVPEETAGLGGRSGLETTEPGEGRLSACEIKVTPGMKYDVRVVVQGVYDRGDFRAGLM